MLGFSLKLTNFKFERVKVKVMNHTFKARGAGNGNGASQSGFLNAVRSISDIGKTFSHGRNLGKLQEATINEGTETSSKTPTLKLPEVILFFYLKF